MPTEFHYLTVRIGVSVENNTGEEITDTEVFSVVRDTLFDGVSLLDVLTESGEIHPTDAAVISVQPVD